MNDKEQARKEFIKELYEEQIIIDHKLKELLKRYAEIETTLYWLDDEESINYLYEINLTNKK
jgi:hypothetical protein